MSYPYYEPEQHEGLAGPENKWPSSLDPYERDISDFYRMQETERRQRAEDARTARDEVLAMQRLLPQHIHAGDPIHGYPLNEDGPELDEDEDEDEGMFAQD